VLLHAQHSQNARVYPFRVSRGGSFICSAEDVPHSGQQLGRVVAKLMCVCACVCVYVCLCALCRDGRRHTTAAAASVMQGSLLHVRGVIVEERSARAGVENQQVRTVAGEAVARARVRVCACEQCTSRRPHFVCHLPAAKWS
jgi:hypothetical protein